MPTSSNGAHRSYWVNTLAPVKHFRSNNSGKEEVFLKHVSSALIQITEYTFLYRSSALMTAVRTTVLYYPSSSSSSVASFPTSMWGPWGRCFDKMPPHRPVMWFLARQSLLPRVHIYTVPPPPFRSSFPSPAIQAHPTTLSLTYSSSLLITVIPSHTCTVLDVSSTFVVL